MSNEDGASKALGCILMIIAIPLSALASGFVLVRMWAWFVMPVFAVSPLSIGYALGIALIVSYMTYQGNNNCTQKPRSALEAGGEMLVTALLRPLFTLAIGYIILKCQGR